jgi:uncharacterized protein
LHRHRLLRNPAALTVKQRVITAALVVAVVLVLAWAAMLVATWRFQERMVFQPPRGLPPAQLLDVHRVTYSATDGTALFGYLIGEPRTAPLLLIVFHGNADLARWQIPWARETARATGVSVLLTEYRGYDGNPGTPTYAGAALDARAALTFVTDSLGVPRERLAYFGHSLGSAIAIELAASDPPHVVVLQSPFSSARDMATRMPLPGLSLMWPVISRVHFETERRVRSVTAPVWVAHGDRDFVIPVTMGQRVFAAAAQKGELLVVPGAGHNDVAEQGGRAYWEWLRRALTVR